VPASMEFSFLGSCMGFSATGRGVRDVLGELNVADIIIHVPRHIQGDRGASGDNINSSMGGHCIRRFYDTVRMWQPTVRTPALIWTYGLDVLKGDPSCTTVFWSSSHPTNLFCVASAFPESKNLWNAFIHSSRAIGVAPVLKVFCDVCESYCPEVMNTVEYGCIGAVDGCPQCLEDYAGKFTEDICEYCGEENCVRRAVINSEALEPSQAQ